MALSTLPDQLEKANPDESDKLFDDVYGSGAAKNINDAEQNPNNLSGAEKGVRDQEAKPDVPTAGFKNNFTGKQKITGKGSFLKKKGPLATIIGLLLGGGGAFSIMFAPGIGIVQLKEIMTGDLNDQLSAMDIRSDHMFKAKLKSLQAGGSVCTGAVKIKCKFTTMSEKQVNKFRDAGFKDIKTEKTIPFGRERITSMTAPDGTPISNPQDLTDARKRPAVRSAMNKVYNPLFAGTSDGKAKSIFSLKKISKTKAITGTDVDEQNKALNERTAGADAGSTDGVKKDSKGREYITQGGQDVYLDTDPVKFNELKAGNSSITSGAASVRSTGAKAVTGTLKSGLKGVSLAGAADSVCTVYNTGRAIAAASKVAKSLQLIQFAMIFLNTADSIKAGDATPEEVEFIGNKLTATDSRQEIVNETSTWDGVGDGAPAKMVSNPAFGKNAFDSPGYSVAAYNDAPTLTTRSQQYMVGGGLSGTLSKIMDAIPNLLHVPKKEVKNKCGMIQSWWARGAGLIAGVVVGIGSFGISTAVSIGGSVAVGFAMPFLQAALTDIVAGQVVNSSTEGYEAGDAVFAGSAALFGSLAQSRGLKPLNKAEIKSYLAITNQVKNDVIAAEVYDAKDTPLDVMNQYSFLGMAVRSINPAILKSSSSVPAALVNMPSLLSTAFSGLVPKTYAASEFNPDRFSKCNDEAYEDLKIDADIFCNVRFGLSNEELNLDTEQVIDYMIAGGYINGETGDAMDGPYKVYLDNCANRQDGWGETIAENGSTGSECMTDTFGDSGAETKYFRVYTLDKTINDGMDGEDTPAEAPTTTSQTNTSATTLAQNILDLRDAGKISIQDYSTDMQSDTASRSLASMQLQDIAAGKPVGITTRCGFAINGPITPDPQLLSFLVTLGGTYHYTLNSLFGQCHSRTSSHYEGSAVDFACPVDIVVVDRVSSAYGVSRNNETCAANGHYHYSIGGR